MSLNLNGMPPVRDDEFDSKPRPMMLINEISRLMGAKLREKCDDNPLGQRSARILLRELAMKDGRTQLDLVKVTHLKAPTISVALQKLEHDGLVARKPDEYDMRAVRVFLTDKGRELNIRVKKRIEEEEEAAISVLTESECETLAGLLKKIRNNILNDVKKEDEF